jgi:hypothetical protein
MQAGQQCLTATSHAGKPTVPQRPPLELQLNHGLGTATQATNETLQEPWPERTPSPSFTDPWAAPSNGVAALTDPPQASRLLQRAARFENQRVRKQGA